MRRKFVDHVTDPLAQLKTLLVGSEDRPFKNVSDLAEELTEVWDPLPNGLKVQRVTLNSRLAGVFSGRLPISNTLEQKLAEATRRRLATLKAPAAEILAVAGELERLFRDCSVAWALSKRGAEPTAPSWEGGSAPRPGDITLTPRVDTWVLCPDIASLAPLLRAWSAPLSEHNQPSRITLLVSSSGDASVAWQQVGIAASRASGERNPEKVLSQLTSWVRDQTVRMAYEETQWPCNIVLQSPLGETPVAFVQTVDRDRLARIPFLGFWRDKCLQFDLAVAAGHGVQSYALQDSETAVLAVVRASAN